MPTPEPLRSYVTCCLALLSLFLLFSSWMAIFLFLIHAMVAYHSNMQLPYLFHLPGMLVPPGSSHVLLLFTPQVIQVSVQQGPLGSVKKSFPIPTPLSILFLHSIFSIGNCLVFAFIFCLPYQTVNFLRTKHTRHLEQ